MVQEKWLENSIFKKLNVEFLNINLVIGSFGNHEHIMALLRANKYGLRKQKDLYLLLPKSAQLRNPAYFKYFKLIDSVTAAI